MGLENDSIFEHWYSYNDSNTANSFYSYRWSTTNNTNGYLSRFSNACSSESSRMLIQ